MPDVKLNFSSAGADTIVRETGTLAAKLEQTQKEVEKLTKALLETKKATAHLTSSFGYFKTAASTAINVVVGRNVLNAMSAFQKNLYDISRTSKLTGQSFTELKNSVEDITKSTQLSRSEAATFIKSLQDQTKGAQLSGKAISGLAKMITDEFGPGLKDVQDAMTDLMKIQQRDIFVLEKLQKGMNPKDVVAYAASLVQLGQITDKEYRTLIRASGAFKGLFESAEDKRIKSFNVAVQELEKSFQNLRITVGTPVVNALTKLLTSFSKILGEGDKLVENSKKIQKGLEFAAITASALGLFSVLKRISGLLTGPLGVLFGAGKVMGGAVGRMLGRGQPLGAAGAATAVGAGRGGLGGLSVPPKLIRGAIPVFVVNQQMLGTGEAREANLLAGMESRRRRIGRGRRISAAAEAQIPTPRGWAGALPGRTLGAARRLAVPLGGRMLAGAGMMGLAAVGGQMAGGALRQAGHERLAGGVSAISNIGGGAAMGASLGSIAGPVGTAVGAVVGGIGGLVTSLEDLKKAFPELKPLFEGLDGTMASLKRAFAPLFKQFEGLMPLFKEIGLLIGKTLITGLEWLIKLLAPVIKLVGVIWVNAMKVITPLLFLFMKGLEGIMKVMEPLVDLVAGTFNAIAEAIEATLDKLLDWLPGWTKGVVATGKDAGKKGEGREPTRAGVEAGVTAPQGLTQQEIMSAAGLKTKEAFEKFAKDFNETLSKTQFGGREIGEEGGKFTREQIEKATATLKSIEQIEEIMEVDRGQKRAFMAAAASFESMRELLRKQGMEEKDANEVIKKVVKGRLVTDVGRAAEVAKAGQAVTPEQIGRARQQFAVPLGVEDIKEVTVAQDVLELGTLRLGNAYKNASQQAKSIGEILQTAIGYNQKIADYMARYRGDIEGAVEQLNSNNQLIDTQVEYYKLAHKYLQMMGGIQGVQVGWQQKLADLMKAEGKTEKDIESTITTVGQELNGQLSTLDAINQAESTRTDNVFKIVGAYQSQVDLAGSQVSLLKSQMELTKSMYLGLGPTLDMQIKAIDALKKQQYWVEQQIKSVEQLLASQPDNVEAQNKLIQLKQKAVDLAREELDITKNLREGYLNAMQAFTNVEGAFSKIILKQDLGVAEIMRQFRAPGGLRLGKIGAGGQEPFARWAPKGKMQFEGMESYYRRGETYGEQILPRPGFVNPALAAERSSPFWQAKELAGQTGLPGIGQATPGPTERDILRKSMGPGRGQEEMIRATMGAEGPRTDERKARLEEQIKARQMLVEQQPENVQAKRELEELQKQRKEIERGGERPEAKIIGKLEEILKEIEKTNALMSGTKPIAKVPGVDGAIPAGPGISKQDQIAAKEELLKKELETKNRLEKQFGETKQRWLESSEKLAFPGLASKREIESGVLPKALETEGKNLKLLQDQFAKSDQHANELQKEITELKLQAKQGTAETKRIADQDRKISEDEKSSTRQERVKAESEARQRLDSEKKQESAIDEQYKLMEKNLVAREKPWMKYIKEWDPDRFMKGMSTGMAGMGQQAGVQAGPKQAVADIGAAGARAKPENIFTAITRATQKSREGEEKKKALAAKEDAETRTYWAKSIAAAQKRKGITPRGTEATTPEDEERRLTEQRLAGREEEWQKRQRSKKEEAERRKRADEEEENGVPTAVAAKATQAIANQIGQQQRITQAAAEGAAKPLAEVAQEKTRIVNIATAMGQAIENAPGLGQVADPDYPKPDLFTGELKKNTEVTRQGNEKIEKAIAKTTEPIRTSVAEGDPERGAIRTGLPIAMGASAKQFYSAIGGLFGGGTLHLGLASGGRVGGSGNDDSVPAFLTPGEFVVNRSAAERHFGLLSSINAQKYANGGPVVPPLSLANGGGGFSPKFSINVRGDSVNKIVRSVQEQLVGVLNKMMCPTGTTGRYHDLPNSS
jgi:hypothetical protein